MHLMPNVRIWTHFFLQFDQKLSKCTDQNAVCILSISPAKMIQDRKQEKKERENERFSVWIFLFIVAFDDDDLSITCTGVQCAMCDIVLLSAVKESIHLEDEQATIINKKNELKGTANRFFTCFSRCFF